MGWGRSLVPAAVTYHSCGAGVGSQAASLFPLPTVCKRRRGAGNEQSNAESGREGFGGWAGVSHRRLPFPDREEGLKPF